MNPQHAAAPTIRLALAGLTLLFSAIGSAEAANWYVGTTGSDNTSCGSSTTPCATVNYVISNKLVAGDTVKIKAGTYTNQGTININRNNVILTADDQANRPQLLNSSVNITSSGATVSYLRIRMLSSPGDLYAGVIDVRNYPTIVDNNELWNGGQGVFIYTSKQVTVSNNYIHDLGTPSSDYDNMCVLITNWEKTPAATSYAEAIRITGNELGPNCSGDGVQENSSQGPFPFAYLILDNNKCHDNQEQCFDFKGTPNVKIYNNDIYRNGYGGISDNSAYGGTPNFSIYNNKIHDHTNYAIATQGSGTNWQVYNNLIYNNVTNPEYNYCAVQMPGDANSAFLNNTVYNNGDGAGPRNTCGILTNGNNNQIKNNIFYNNGTGDNGNIYNDAGTPDRNYIYPANGEVGTNAVSTCYQIGNCPGFVNVDAYDFHLLSGSPAIDKGINPPTSLYIFDNVNYIDYSGLQRPQGDAIDLGAYEYNVGGSTIILQPPSYLRIQ